LPSTLDIVEVEPAEKSAIPAGKAWRYIARLDCGSGGEDDVAVDVTVGELKPSVGLVGGRRFEYGDQVGGLQLTALDL
jgi:hypothetical protein